MIVHEELTTHMSIFFENLMTDCLTPRFIILTNMFLFYVFSSLFHWILSAWWYWVLTVNNPILVGMPCDVLGRGVW